MAFNNQEPFPRYSVRELLETRKSFGKAKAMDAFLTPILLNLPGDHTDVDLTDVRIFLRNKLRSIDKKYIAYGRRWDRFVIKDEQFLSEEFTFILVDDDDDDIDLVSFKEDPDQPGPSKRGRPSLSARQKRRRLKVVNEFDSQEGAPRAENVPINLKNSTTRRSFSAEEATSLVNKLNLGCAGYNLLRTECAGIGHDIFPSHHSLTEVTAELDLQATVDATVKIEMD